MANLLILFFASAPYIGLRAFQSINVIHGHHKAVIATSMAIGQVEIFLIGTTAYVFANTDTLTEKMIAGGVLGLSGIVGCLSSMWIHKRRQ